ncbi:MAG: hypothetical protein FWG91_10900 [Lachnospiraceae bacterium]|nr:hypothetical protein [Lachnospiraceae bacterium]
MSKEENVVFEKEIAQKIKEIDCTMALEGMPLTKAIKETLKKCYYGLTSPELEIEKLKEKYKQIHG